MTGAQITDGNVRTRMQRMDATPIAGEPRSASRPPVLLDGLQRVILSPEGRCRPPASSASPV